MPVWRQSDELRFEAEIHVPAPLSGHSQSASGPEKRDADAEVVGVAENKA